MAHNLVAMSDLHCGALYGLTHPEFQTTEHQATIYSWWLSHIRSCGPIDSLLIVGDAIDGKQNKSGSRSLITADRRQQCVMARKVIEDVGARNIMVIEGTPYHTGNDESWEEVLADMVGADFGRHPFVQIEEVLIDAKHKVGGGSIPHTIFTALAREALMNLAWSETGVQPRAQITFRGHTHRYKFSGDARTAQFGLPACELWTDHGELSCTSLIDFGFLQFKIDGASWSHVPHLMDLRPFAPKVIVYT